MRELEQTLEEIGWLPADSNDDAFLRELYFELKGEEFEPLGLPEVTLSGLLEQQYVARCTGYALAFPDARTFVKLGVGCLIVSTGTTIHLVDVIISKSARGQGFGSELLSAILALGKPVTLKVDLHNPARKLYERLGFREIGATDMQADMIAP
ncbi:MAG: GNAT family N-acetyltransferase [Fimbriimonadaceae bacterium]